MIGSMTSFYYMREKYVAHSQANILRSLRHSMS